MIENFRIPATSLLLSTSTYILHLAPVQAMSSNCILLSRYNERLTMISYGEREVKLACWSNLELSLYLLKNKTTVTSYEVSILCCQSAQMSDMWLCKRGTRQSQQSRFHDNSQRGKKVCKRIVLLTPVPQT